MSLFTFLTSMTGAGASHGGWGDAPIVIPLSGGKLPAEYDQIDFKHWSKKAHKALKSSGRYQDAFAAHTKQEYEMHEPHGPQGHEAEAFIGTPHDYCDSRVPTTNPDIDPNQYQMELGSHRNCLFTQAWVEHMLESDVDDEERLDTEYKFAFAMWSSRFGRWYQSCLPNDNYADVWPGVGGVAPTGEDGGLARCQVKPINGEPTAVACQCYPLDDNYKYNELTKQDVQLVMEGNCPSGQTEDCLPGAKKIAKSRGWGKEMQWMAILESLDDILHEFTEGVHLNVEDVYYLNRHYPEMLADDCTSCQIFAAMRPMPYIEGVNRNFIRDDMYTLGKTDTPPADEYYSREDEDEEEAIGDFEKAFGAWM